MKKYSKGFETAFKFYLSFLHTNCDGLSSIGTGIKDKNGVSSKEAFFIYESTGKMVSTKHPITFARLVNAKKYVQWHITEWANDNTMFRRDVEDMLDKWKAPEFVRNDYIGQVRRRIRNHTMIEDREDRLFQLKYDCVSILA